jgi:hypothetical protein
LDEAGLESSLPQVSASLIGFVDVLGVQLPDAFHQQAATARLLCRDE